MALKRSLNGPPEIGGAGADTLDGGAAFLAYCKNRKA